MLIETRTVYMIHMVKRNSNTHDDHRSMTFFSVFGCWKLQNLTNNPRNRNVKEQPKSMMYCDYFKQN